ncbi:MAG: MEDS domain-containing protein [Gemmatimonadaceae bacterium]|nr:MEDS domain-containing protein [Actinomycetota bacterium]
MRYPRTRRSSGTVELGLRDERVNLGDHIAYFWEKPEEFEEAVQFLITGHRRGEHLVIFGHDEANQKILAILKGKNIDPDTLRSRGQLSVLGGGSTGDGMLNDIGQTFQKAIDAGAGCIRLLGNIGWGRNNWPDDLDILAFEAKVTGAAKLFPSVVVCMYDVGSLSGRVIVHGAYETHPLTFHGNLLRENPFYVGVDEYLARLKGSDEPLTADA